MTAMQYLYGISALRRKIDRLILKQEELEIKAEGLRAILYDKEKVQTSVQNQFDTIMVKLVEVKEKIDKAQQELDEREAAICQVKNFRYRNLLLMKYYDGVTDNNILAGRINCRRSDLRYFTYQARKAFERAYKNLPQSTTKTVVKS